MNITLTFPAAPPAPVPPARVVGFRGLHVAEGGRVPDPLGSPGIIPPYNPTVALPMTKDIQLMSYDLMAHFHPAVRADRNRWRIMHGYRVAMNNGVQNGYDGGTLHADFVNGWDISTSLPRYDKMQRTFAGSLITGQQVGNVIWCEPGVDAIDARGFVYEPGTPEAIATLGEILVKHWFSYAVAETAEGAFRIKDHWGDGIIVFPFILDRPVSFLAEFFTAWDEVVYPDPLTVYLRQV